MMTDSEQHTVLILLTVMEPEMMEPVDYHYSLPASVTPVLLLL
jgi:hypothetical protein